MQNLIGWCDDIRPFPIGSYYCDGRFVRYEDIADVPAPMQDDMDTILTNIREKLIAGVEKRLDADAPVGFLLSGGLDSSLVCSIAAKKLGKPIRTFAIGMDTDAIDLKYARQTAEYLGSGIWSSAALKRSSVCWVPGTSPPSAPAWGCTCCARLSTSRPMCACC